MSQPIGLAGWNYGKGRVAAFTKAINYEDIKLPEDESLFTRFFLNACLWASRNSVTNYGNFRKVSIIGSRRSFFDSRIQSLLSSLQIFGQTYTSNPWFENDADENSIDFDLYVLIPSYSALGGNKMPDARQQRIMNQIKNNGSGLIIAEWFHLLQSITVKKSFSFASNNNDGLFTVSPLKIERTPLIFTKTNEFVFVENKYDDSISSTLPKTFGVNNQEFDTPFDGNLTQIYTVKDGATIFWSTTLEETVTTTTTTTTTTIAPTEKIKMKVGTLNLINACGPQKLYLDGPYKDYFLLENNELFLIKNIKDEQKIALNIVAEDYFNTKRFNKIIETIEVDFVNCFAPISRPIDRSGPAFSFRLNANLVKNAWGEFAPVGVIVPFEDYVFVGDGSSDNPTVVSLGGNHSDSNALWMQVNEGGIITYTISASTEQHTFIGDQQYSYDYKGDIGCLFLIRNTLTSNIKPTQHLTDLETLWLINHSNVVQKLSGTNFQNNVSGTNSFSGSVTVKDPNELDGQGNRIRGDIFIVLYFKKDMIRSELEDKVFATLFFGTTSTTPPPTFEFNVVVQNNVPFSSTDLGGSVIKFTGPVKTSDSKTFELIPAFGRELSGVDVDDDSDIIISDVLSSSISPNQKTIEVRLTEMPVNGGNATLVISGNTNTTTTAAPPETYEVTVNITNLVNNLLVNNSDGTDLADYGETSTLVRNLQIGIYTFLFTYNTKSGYEYRNSDKPTATRTSSNPTDIFKSVNVSRSNNFQGNILVEVDVPEDGGEINIDLQAPDPVPTTTTTTTTTAEPCDNTIIIICEQVLECVDDGNGGCEPSVNSFQRLVFDTCCVLTDEEILDIIRQHNNASENATLNDMYGSECPITNFEYKAQCLPKDLEGNCNQIIHSEPIDFISCGSSFNPLP